MLSTEHLNDVQFGQSFYAEFDSLNDAVLDRLDGQDHTPNVVYRPAGNNYMLV